MVPRAVPPWQAAHTWAFARPASRSARGRARPPQQQGDGRDLIDVDRCGRQGW